MIHLWTALSLFSGQKVPKFEYYTLALVVSALDCPSVSGFEKFTDGGDGSCYSEVPFHLSLASFRLRQQQTTREDLFIHTVPVLIPTFLLCWMPSKPQSCNKKPCRVDILERSCQECGWDWRARETRQLPVAGMMEHRWQITLIVILMQVSNLVFLYFFFYFDPEGPVTAIHGQNVILVTHPVAERGITRGSGHSSVVFQSISEIQRLA